MKAAPPDMPFDVLPRRIDARSSALADEVHAVLVTAILDGHLAPGERLRDIQLAEHLGVSRTPVREAMLRLQRQGLVEVAAHRYTRVSELTPQMRDEAVEFLGYVVGMGLRLGLPRMAEEQIDAIVRLIDEVLAALRTSDDHGVRRHSGKLHREIIMAAGNRVYANVLDEYAMPMRRHLVQWSPFDGDRARTLESYAVLRLAVQERDGDRAERAVREQHGLN